MLYLHVLLRWVQFSLSDSREVQPTKLCYRPETNPAGFESHSVPAILSEVTNRGFATSSTASLAVVRDRNILFMETMSRIGNSMTPSPTAMLRPRAGELAPGGGFRSAMRGGQPIVDSRQQLLQPRRDLGPLHRSAPPAARLHAGRSAMNGSIALPCSQCAQRTARSTPLLMALPLLPLTGGDQSARSAPLSSARRCTQRDPSPTASQARELPLSATMQNLRAQCRSSC